MKPTTRQSVCTLCLVLAVTIILPNIPGSLADAMRMGRAANTATTKNLIESALLKLSQIGEAPNKNQVPCTCGVFLSGQFEKGSPDPPKGNPALMHEPEVMLPCNPQGIKMCTNRCLELVSSLV